MTKCYQCGSQLIEGMLAGPCPKCGLMRAEAIRGVGPAEGTQPSEIIELPVLPANAGESAPRRTIWQELEEWRRTLRPWQQFVLLRAVNSTRLEEADVSEAYRLFVEGAGLAPATAPAMPTAIVGRPDAAAPPGVRLKRLGKLVSVNALPATAALTFGADLTVVFGANATGKTGFSRILARACFSRSRPTVLPDVFAEGAPQAPLAAEFVVDGPGGERPIAFVDGADVPELRRISVFDAAVARSHLSDESPVTFQPSGFDVFAEMTRVYGELSRRLEADIRLRSSANPALGKFEEAPSAVSEAVAALSPDTDLVKLHELGTFGEGEARRIEEVDRLLTELRRTSATEAIASLGEARDLVEKFRDSLRALVALLSTAATAKYAGQVRDAVAADRLAAAESIDAFKALALSSLGTAVWDRFLAAARALAIAENPAYPRAGDQCLFCARPLDAESVELIGRYWRYLDGVARANAKEARTALARTLQTLREAAFDALKPDRQLRTHLERLRAPLLPRLDELLAQLAGSRDAIVEALAADREPATPAPVAELIPDLDRLMEDIRTQIATLEGKDTETAIATHRVEYRQLRHRSELARFMPAIETHLADLRWVKLANAHRGELNTRAITERQDRLHERLIGKQYTDRLAEECRAIDCEVQVQLQARPSKGKTFLSLGVKGHKPTAVFSEGEQRGLALADFLTEVGLDATASGIVLDDPVTSFDHKRKDPIAARLAEEARRRQVIVFTHDVVFLSKLLAAAEDKGLTPVTHWVQRDGGGRPGMVTLNDAPAGGRSFKDASRAKESLRRAKELGGSGREALVVQGMGELRTTIEQMVEERLLKGVVKRWDEQVRVPILKSVAWSDALIDEIDRVYGELSRYILAHSHTDEARGAPPDVEDLERMIPRVEELGRKCRPARV